MAEVDGQAAKIATTNQVKHKYVHELRDVSENNPPDGSCLVWNAETNKYEVKIIDLKVIVLDGGLF
jgi:hypothetical protein